jgi:EAL domain-containing protein (putative c-di-GMP-specific phosphodiesterase class I)
MLRMRHPNATGQEFLLVATDPKVIAAAHEAARRLMGVCSVLIVSGAEALFRLTGPGKPPRHLVLEGGTAEDALLHAARDRFGATEVVVVTQPGEAAPTGLRGAPAEAGRLAQALAGLGVPTMPAPRDAAALADGLDRGEITVRFQPVVRLPDRRPVLLEALARWERQDVAHPAADFIAVAEAGGLAMRLTLSVVARALAELRAALGPRRPLRLAFNVPLAVLLRDELPQLLHPIVTAAGFRPEDLLLELTESEAVRDTALLRRALQRLGQGGFRVVLDDLGLDDGREGLLDLPFAGLKFDRALVAALPHARRARRHLEQVAQAAHRQGRVVIAEGIAEAALWRAATAAGCDLAQGFGVGRPMVAGALPAWIAGWAGAALRLD